MFACTLGVIALVASASVPAQAQGAPQPPSQSEPQSPTPPRPTGSGEDAAAPTPVVAPALPRTATTATTAPASPPVAVPPAKPPLTVAGYVETYYQWNFNRPSTSITNARGFDNRHNSFTLSNAALDLGWDDERTFARLVMQVGHTPATYYSSEPQHLGGSAANTSDATLWRMLQQANGGVRLGARQQYEISAGLFLSPIGPETMPIRENWNWSRSNLFFGLPFYHTGARFAYQASTQLSLTAAIYNGWNSIVDNNADKSISVSAAYRLPTIEASLLYFGGTEDSTSPTPHWRHLLDAIVTWKADARTTLRFHGNAGGENDGDTAGRQSRYWLAAAGYANFALRHDFAIAVRGDLFYEPTRAGATSRIFWPVAVLGAATLTAHYQVTSGAHLYTEVRGDYASGRMYDNNFDNELAQRAKRQHTAMLGVVVGF